MRRIFSSKMTTKDVVIQYQTSMQQLIDAMHQVQRDIKCLKDLQAHNAEVSHDENTEMLETLQKLHDVTITNVGPPAPSPSALRLDMQQGFEEVLDSLQIITEKQARLLQQSQAPERKMVRRTRPVGLIEGVFRGLDLLLLKGFMKAANRHCAV